MLRQFPERLGDARAHAERALAIKQTLDPAAAQILKTDLQRLSLYGYYHWQLVDPLWLIAGVSYDRLRFPENADQPPINGREATRDQVSQPTWLITGTDPTGVSAAAAAFTPNSLRNRFALALTGATQLPLPLEPGT